MIADCNLGKLASASLRYKWRGLTLAKSPFDLALIPKLLWEHQPKTVFEFGSYDGGSAVWIRDVLAAFGIQAWVYSVDTRKVKLCGDECYGVSWIQDDIRTMDFAALMDGKPHPWLVLEDSDHQAITVKRVLGAFADGMEPGDRFVVEDGVVTEQGQACLFGGGPGAAIEEFLKDHPGFHADRALCDFWGPNVTFNPDGYLVKGTHARAC